MLSRLPGRARGAARRMRHPRSHNAKNGHGHILDMVSIRERLAEIEDRAVPGHWEEDLLTGANDTHIASLVERNTRFTMLVNIPRKDTTTVVAALAKHISKLHEQLLSDRPDCARNASPRRVPYRPP